MPVPASSLSQRGQFRALYNGLKSQKLLDRTPVILCEGDSWFSNPLYMNMLDWIVSPSPQDNEAGVPLLGQGGLFFRAEHSGDQAIPQTENPSRSMFTKDNVSDLVGWFGKFNFDAVLLSAGGNDFVDTWLKQVMAGKANLSPQQALDVIVATGRFDDLRKAYAFFLDTFHAAKPNVPILAHTYDYPRLIGSAAHLGLGNLGIAALLKKSIGPWIGPYIEPVIPGGLPAWQAFVKLLIDGFVERVLQPLKEAPAYHGMFDYVDLRGQLTSDAQWNDEMHPNEVGFHVLATVFRGKLIGKLPVGKR
ncbi:hypothetical protein [Luteibacter yeojuensis]|uniref:SGNH hydrolase-type esterase domain-containing protein n=1 Tax=Luteibacter yeojuensis TaxID=345309 RepID=A0A0F3L0K3_9GAMM|nr:hypothetical protein [Luteibacter yeojuensis]KJV36732.1 hypothetical protein VI08_02900 [Luteibacter yeojuensis]